MNRSMEERYVTHTQIQTFSKKQLFYGEDLSLQREVMLYIIENIDYQTYNDYIRKFKKASSFVHAGFQHILDTSIEDNSIFIVLEHKSGNPLLLDLKKQEWVFNRIITLISDLGVSMLDGMEEQITGFSVGVDNLWLSGDDRLSIINFWEDGEPQFTGPLGLCSLVIQLSSGSTQIPDPFKALDNYLQQFDQLQASTEQKSALIKLVRRAYHGQSSLSSLVIGLQGLLHIKSPMDDIPAFIAPIPAAPIPAAPVQQPTAPYNMEILPPEENEEEDAEDTIPFYKRKFSLILGLFFAALLIWIIWPSSQHSNNPADASPVPSIQSSITPTAISTLQPSPSEDNSVVMPGEEIAIPNLIGMTLEQADKQLRHLRLHYNYHIEVHAETASGTVFKQDIPPETKAAQGDRVVFWITK
jgi:eukaryotic-like serine/threonine-protein kinase